MNKWAKLAEEYMDTEDNFDILVECVSKRPEEYAAQITHLKKGGDFYSGILVALQTVVGFGEDTIAQEIIDGLGYNGVLDLVGYARMEGGVDMLTVDTLINKNIICVN